MRRRIFRTLCVSLKEVCSWCKLANCFLTSPSWNSWGDDRWENRLMNHTRRRTAMCSSRNLLYCSSNLLNFSSELDFSREGDIGDEERSREDVLSSACISSIRRWLSNCCRSCSSSCKRCWRKETKDAKSLGNEQSIHVHFVRWLIQYPSLQLIDVIHRFLNDFLVALHRTRWRWLIIPSWKRILLLLIVVVRDQ